MGAQPVAEIVKKSGKSRRSRGFSKAELREVKLDFQQALRMHIPVDTRRKTKLGENVKTLKQILRKK